MSDAQRFGLAVTVLTTWLIAWPTPSTRALAPLRVVLRSATVADRALVPRLRGQLSDLEARLDVVDTVPLEAATSDPLELARALAMLHRADVVVWCESPSAAHDGKSPAWFVHLLVPKADRLLTRRWVPASPGGLSSGELETVAVLVRSALLALGQGATIGVPVRERPPSEPRPSEAAAQTARAAEPAPADGQRERAPQVERSDEALSVSRPQLEPPPQTSAQAEARVDRAEDRRPRRAPGAPPLLRARLSLGAQLLWDGESVAGQRGVHARVGFSAGAWMWSAYGVFAFPAALDDPYFALRIARHAVGLAIEHQLRVRETLRLGLAIHGGALLIRRTSAPARAGAVSTPASLMAALVLGPELALHWLPARYGVSLRLGLDWLPAAPRFALADSTVSHVLWALSPRATLGWEAAWP